MTARGPIALAGGRKSGKLRPLALGLSDPTERAHQALARFCEIGDKRAAGAGDEAVGAWIEEELSRLGYLVAREYFTTTWSNASVASLTWSGGAVPLIGHPASPTGSVVGPLIRRAAETAGLGPAGPVAVLDLPHARWSSARDLRIQGWVQSAVDHGAEAVVLVTHGPSGLAVQLNTGAAGDDFTVPVAVLSPREALGLPLQEGAEATFRFERQDESRNAFNVVGRIDRGADRTLVLSTPRSGWSTCAGERGSGLAAWLLLVEQAAHSLHDTDIVALSTTAHERGSAGMRAHLSRDPTPVDRAALWVHIGANAAARDWREVPGSLAPLPSADPQRFLAVSASLLTASRRCFAGSPGLEAPHDVAHGSGGELGDIAAAGYGAVVGVFGAHRFHHTQADDLSCVSAELSVDTAERMSRLIRSALSRTG